MFLNFAKTKDVVSHDRVAERRERLKFQCPDEFCGVFVAKSDSADVIRHKSVEFNDVLNDILEVLL